ncbi:MAG: WD40 repeat domain-containing protein, partial [Saprospiraceae bacterium]|nr:WD40 repeat domain-containing protein [Saprospiraceae bacterium]
MLIICLAGVGHVTAQVNPCANEDFSDSCFCDFIRNGIRFLGGNPADSLIQAADTADFAGAIQDFWTALQCPFVTPEQESSARLLINTFNNAFRDKSYLDFIRAEASRLAHVANVEQGKGKDTDAVALAYLGWYRLEEEGEEIMPIVKEAFGNAVFARDRKMIAARDTTVKGFRSLAFSPDESRVLVYSMVDSLTLAASSGLNRTRHQTRPVRAAGFTADGQRLVLVGDNFWEVRDDLAGTSNPQSLDAPQTHLAMHPHRMEAAIGGRDGKVHIIHLETGDVTASLPGVAPIRSLSYSPDGLELLIASIDGTVTRRSHDGKDMAVGAGSMAYPYTVAYANDSQVLAAWGNGRVHSDPERDHAGLTSAARSAIGRLITVSEDGSVMLNQQIAASTAGGTLRDIPLQVVFLSDNRYVATRKRSAVRLWQVAGDNLQEIQRLTHTAGKDITGMVA